MNEEKQKKIRTKLINFMNQELIRQKKSGKPKFMINSMTLEELEKKNMQCKDFYIKEKDQIYQNIDNGWTIGLNIYINNSFSNNPYIHSLSNIIKDNYIINDIRNKKGINISTINNIDKNKETIIQKKSDKILYILKEGNMGSPVNTSLLIKKELGERKLKRNNNEYNSNKIPLYSEQFFIKDNLEINIKENEKGKETNCINNNANIINDIEDININKLQKQLSNETLETEISLIIKIVQDEKYTHSFPSDSKISILSKEIKIAKMYAKKLKLYCRTLKRKNPLNTDNINKPYINIKDKINKNFQKLFEEREDNNKPTYIKTDINNNNNEKKNKKFPSKNNFDKLKEEKINLDNGHGPIIPRKKIKSEKNVKKKIKRKSLLKIIKEIDNNTKYNKNNLSMCSNNNKHRTIDEKKSKRKIYVLKIHKKRNKKLTEEENLTKSKNRKKELIKSPKILKNKINKRINKNHKTMNDIDISDIPKLSRIKSTKKKRKMENDFERRKKKISTEADRRNNSKKLKKLRKKLEDYLKNKIKSNKHTIKNGNKKRISVEAKINMTGFEKLNFLKLKTKSTQDQLFFNNKKKKKSKLKLSHLINNNVNPNPNPNPNTNYNTNIKKPKNSSKSIGRNKKHKKSNHENKYTNTLQYLRSSKDKKTKTFAFLKTKRTSTVIEALKKMKKKESNQLNDNIDFYNDRKFYSICNEKNINNTILDINKKNMNNSRKSKIKLNKNINELWINNANDGNQETDIFNIMDEFLYKKKHLRRRNIIN